MNSKKANTITRAWTKQ